MTGDYKQWVCTYFGHQIYRYFWDEELTRPRALYSCSTRRGTLLTGSTLAEIKGYVKKFHQEGYE